MRNAISFADIAFLIISVVSRSCNTIYLSIENPLVTLLTTLSGLLNY